MSALTRKLGRDLGRMRGSAAAISLLITLGVGVYVGSVSTHRSLERSRDEYYRRYRFADLFVRLSRAPRPVTDRLARIPGVAAARSRLATMASIVIEGFSDPVTARIVSIPSEGEAAVSALHLTSGRRPASAGREVVISQAFAEAQGLAPGDTLRALINGNRIELVVCGVGISPEHVYEVRPGAVMPDNLRYGVLWMGRLGLAGLLGMRGAFNEAMLRLDRGVAAQPVISAVDDTLSPYGGRGAFGRDRQTSARLLDEELEQLETTAFFVPAIFLAVAAFLIHIVLGRTIATQREQIAMLKALGYGNGAVGLHYTGMTLAMAIPGLFAGTILGYLMGGAMTELYSGYFHFPSFDFGTTAFDVASAGGVSLLAALTSTVKAVRRAATLQPAEAMKPPAPAVFCRTLPERIGLDRILEIPGRMILRHIWRHPLRAGATCLAIAFAVALVVTGLFFGDAMRYVVNLQFGRAERQDATVTFSHAVSIAAVDELARLSGVRAVEPERLLPVRIRFRHRSERTAVIGLPRHPRLRRVLDSAGAVLPIPTRGLLMSETLANNLGVSRGDVVDIELIERQDQGRRLPVTAIADEPFGTSVYASLATVDALAGTGPRMTDALLTYTDPRAGKVFDQLTATPRVAGITLRRAMRESFAAMSGDLLLFFAGVLSLFAGGMTVGVVYNAARVALSERSRDLATMRILGMTRREIAVVLLGELAVTALAAFPAGAGLGYLFAAATARSASTEMYSIPLVIRPQTYLTALAIVGAACVFVGIVVLKKVYRLDLLSALKTRE